MPHHFFHPEIKESKLEASKLRTEFRTSFAVR
jgi:hypothetical protein